MRGKSFIFLFKRKQIILAFTLAAIILILLTLKVFENSNNALDTWKRNHTLKEILFHEYNVRGKISIIIDDFGNHGDGTSEMLRNIKRPLTCAIMPFMPYTKEEAELAHELGHEVIIHIPMEPHKGNPEWLGAKAITTLLSTEEVKHIIREAIEDVPYAVGVNNHMGSKATEDKRVIQAIIEVLKEKDMFIVDSKTSQKSVIREIAEEYGVKVYERDVFLDNSKDLYNIKKQIKKLELVAEENKIAIGIGHVGPEGGKVTAKAIQEMIPEIESLGLIIVPISMLGE